MRCPNCNYCKTDVKNTRNCKYYRGELKEVYQGWMERKRHCPKCGAYFWTIEQFDRYTDDTQMKMIKGFMEDTIKDPNMLEEVRKAVGFEPEPLKLNINFGGQGNVKS